MPKVSIIIPVFNAAKTISKCLKSALSQTLFEIEIIIIDDGSTDESVKLIKKIMHDDQRIKLVTQLNQSVGIARTNGLIIARGDYISFLDADDTMLPQMLEIMYQNGVKNSSDIVVCNYNEVNEIDNIIQTTNFDKLNIDFRSLLNMKINPATWNKIYKKELFNNHHIKFKENIFCEDLASTLKPFYHAKNISFVEKPLYNYFINPSGASNNLKEKLIDDIFVALEENKVFLKNNSILSSYIGDFLERYIIQIHNINDSIQKLTNKEKKESFIKYLKNKIISHKIFEQKDFFTYPEIFIKSLHNNLRLYYEYDILFLTEGSNLNNFQTYTLYESYSNSLALLNLNSVFIYGSQSIFFDQLVFLLNSLNIKINGIIESIPPENTLLSSYPCGTLKNFGKDLNNASILINSKKHFNEIEKLIETFSYENNFQIARISFFKR